MAKAKKFYIYPRRGGQWWIGVRKNGETVAACPRERYKHLDGEPLHNVEFWVSQHLEHPEPQPRSDLELTGLVEQFAAFYREAHRDGTVDEHRRHLLQHVVPYFLAAGLRDLAEWPSGSVRMTSVLRAQGLTDHQIYRSNVALRKFYKWCQEEHKAPKDAVILCRNPSLAKYDEDTPLERTMDPADVLKLVKHQKDPDYKKYLLLGYFFSLRPQEIFGVRVDDFRTGAEVAGLECAKTMRALVDFDRMAVHVGRQRTKKKDLAKALTPPKKNSKGWVACINRDAARLFVGLLDGAEPDSFVLGRSPSKFYKEWPFDFEPKDLRRASLYWLGHNTEITIIQLQKHARQKSEKSLQLYLRRPEEKLAKWTGLKVADL